MPRSWWAFPVWRLDWTTLRRIHWMNKRNPMEPFLAAAVQDTPVFLDLRRSVQKACDLISKAAATGAKLIVFPETWLPGYPVWLDESPKAALWDYAPAKALFAHLFENSIALPGPELEQLGKAAKAAEPTVAMGAHERSGGTLYNTLFYIAHTGELAGIHRKIMPTYTERLIWGQGDGSTLTVIDTPQGRVGGLICWEHWMPLLRAAMHQRKELIHVAQWPTVKEINQVAVRQYAFEGQCFVIAAGSILTKKAICTNEPNSSQSPAKSTNKPNPSQTPSKTPNKPNSPDPLDGGPPARAERPRSVSPNNPNGTNKTRMAASLATREAGEGNHFLSDSSHLSQPDVFFSGQPNSLLEEIPGDPSRVLLRGGSAIIAPDGSYLAGPLYDESGILTAEIRPSLAVEGRLLLDTCGPYSRPDIFRLSVNTEPQENVVFHSGSSK